MEPISKQEPRRDESSPARLDCELASLAEAALVAAASTFNADDRKRASDALGVWGDWLEETGDFPEAAAVRWLREHRAPLVLDFDGWCLCRWSHPDPELFDRQVRAFASMRATSVEFRDRSSVDAQRNTLPVSWFACRRLPDLVRVIAAAYVELRRREEDLASQKASEDAAFD